MHYRVAPPRKRDSGLSLHPTFQEFHVMLAVLGLALLTPSARRSLEVLRHQAEPAEPGNEGNRIAMRNAVGYDSAVISLARKCETRNSTTLRPERDHRGGERAARCGRGTDPANAQGARGNYSQV